MAATDTPRTVNMHEAKTHLSRLVDRVAAGEEIVIARNGKPAARLVAIEDKPKKRPGYGAGKGTGWFAPGWEKTDPETLRAFEESIDRELPS
jgi:prevent-host-death family protein